MRGRWQFTLRTCFVAISFCLVAMAFWPIVLYGAMWIFAEWFFVMLFFSVVVMYAMAARRSCDRLHHQWSLAALVGLLAGSLVAFWVRHRLTMYGADGDWPQPLPYPDRLLDAVLNTSIRLRSETTHASLMSIVNLICVCLTGGFAYCLGCSTGPVAWSVIDSFWQRIRKG